MANKKKPSLGVTMRNIMLLIPNLVSIASNITSLINLETRLAGRALLTLVVLAVMTATILTSSWLCILALVFMYLSSLQVSVVASLLVLLLLNIVLLILIGNIMLKVKKDLQFPALTRQYRNLCKDE